MGEEHKRYLSIPLILILFSVGACCSTTSLPPITKDFRIEADEKRLWQRSKDEQELLNKSGRIYEDKKLEDYLNEIARRLQPRETLEHISFRIRVIKDPYLNAFAFPDGALYIHSGILVRMENEAQLAILLAHEMTHAIQRHALRAFRDLKNRNAFLAGVKGTITGLDGAGGLVTLLGSKDSMASVTGYAQEFETEADMKGLGLVIRAGYDPNEAIRLLVHLKKELEEEKTEGPFFFGAYPIIQNRIESCENFLNTDYQGERRGIKNTDIFLARLHKIVLDNAWLDLKAGRFYSAERGAKRYLEKRPNEAKAYYLLGEIFRQRGRDGDRKRAKVNYKKAISIDPNYADPYKGIGIIYYKEGENGLAKRFFETGLSLSPHAPDKTYIQGYLRQCNE